MAKKADSGAIMTSSAGAIAKMFIEQDGEQKNEEAEKKKAPTKKKTGRPKKRENYVRLCIAIPEETRNQLDVARLEESKPGHVLSVTDIIILLAEQDAKRRARRKKQ